MVWRLIMYKMLPTLLNFIITFEIGIMVTVSIHIRGIWDGKSKWDKAKTTTQSGGFLNYPTWMYITGMMTGMIKLCNIAFFFFFCLFAISWAAPVAYGGSRARGSIGACSCRPTPQQHGIWAASATYSTAHGNARSLTHWARAGIAEEKWFLMVPSRIC